MALYWTGTLNINEVSHHSLPSTYAYICHYACGALIICYTHSTGVPMILVELDVVAIRWVRQQTLYGAKFHKNRKPYFFYRLSQYQLKRSSDDLHKNKLRCVTLRHFLTLSKGYSVGHPY